MKKLFENWRNHLKEIGDAGREPYPFKQLPSVDKGRLVMYLFDAKGATEGEKLEYQVIFRWTQGFHYYWDIEFNVDGAIPETGVGEPLKIMSTVVAIIKDFINNDKINKGARKYGFEGVSKGTHNDEEVGETQRTKLYKRYLERNLPPNSEVRISGNNVIWFCPGGPCPKKKKPKKIPPPEPVGDGPVFEGDYPITKQRADKEINQVITPTKPKNARTKLPGWKKAKANYKGSASPGSGGS